MQPLGKGSSGQGVEVLSRGREEESQALFQSLQESQENLLLGTSGRQFSPGGGKGRWGEGTFLPSQGRKQDTSLVDPTSRSRSF